MTRLKSLAATALIGVMAGGALAAAATSASAEVACNRFGDCWHVQNRYTNYPVGLGVTFHGNDWRAAHRFDHRWRWRADRDNDHGYYRNGVWVGF